MSKELAALETHLAELRDFRASGAATRETSYYTPLANLLNEVGRSLKPRIRSRLDTGQDQLRITVHIRMALSQPDRTRNC